MATSQEFTKTLATQAQSQTLDIFVPSLGTSVKFRPVSCKQDCSLLKYKSDQSTFNGIQILNELTGIILNNCVDVDVMTKLSTIDRSAILVQMRYSILQQIKGNEVELDKLARLIDSYHSITEDVKKLVAQFSLDLITFNNISITPYLPTLQQEYRYYKLVDIHIQNVQKDKLPTTLYLLEVAKFIKQVIVGTTESVTLTEDYSISDMAEMLQLLPTVLIKKVTQLIVTLREVEFKCLELPADDDKSLPYRVRIDSNIFNT